MLGLLLCYLGSQMTIKWLCLIFGISPLGFGTGIHGVRICRETSNPDLKQKNKKVPCKQF
jgi:hypothetical protein